MRPGSGKTNQNPAAVGRHVLVISSFTASQYIAAAARFGAAGFLFKAAPLPALLEAIRAVADGDTVFSTKQLAERFVALTPREREVLALAMEGRSNKEIGARIGTSRKTIEAHLSEIFRKYEILGGRVELTIRASEERWLEIQPPPPKPERSGDPSRSSPWPAVSSTRSRAVPPGRPG